VSLFAPTPLSLSLNSLSQLYTKIFMPALPVSDILNMKCIHYTVKRTILCNNFKKYTFSGCLYVSAAGKVSSKSGKPNPDSKLTLNQRGNMTSKQR